MLARDMTEMEHIICLIFIFIQMLSDNSVKHDIILRPTTMCLVVYRDMRVLKSPFKRCRSDSDGKKTGKAGEHGGGHRLESADKSSLSLTA